jgi:hypothetical protein
MADHGAELTLLLWDLAYEEGSSGINDWYNNNYYTGRPRTLQRQAKVTMTKGLGQTYILGFSTTLITNGCIR